MSRPPRDPRDDADRGHPDGAAERRAPLAPREITAVLAARGLNALHRYGQNFLTRSDALERIVATAGVSEDDVVLEVGPGLGALTERLLGRGARVIAVEIDRGFCSFLRELFGPDERLQIIEGDVLSRKSTLSSRVQDALRSTSGAAGTFKVVSNLPYQISSPFLASLITLEKPRWTVAAVLVQREVGDVLTAGPGSPAYSPLSFLARLYLHAKRELRLGPASFYPSPRVDSVLMRLEPRTEGRLPPARLLPFARRLFTQRRKALRRTVPAALARAEPRGRSKEELRHTFEVCGIDPGARIDGVEPERIEMLLRELERPMPEGP